MVDGYRAAAMHLHFGVIVKYHGMREWQKSDVALNLRSTSATLF